MHSKFTRHRLIENILLWIIVNSLKLHSKFTRPQLKCGVVQALLNHLVAAAARGDTSAMHAHRSWVVQWCPPPLLPRPRPTPLTSEFRVYKTFRTRISFWLSCESPSNHSGFLVNSGFLVKVLQINSFWLSCESPLHISRCEESDQPAVRACYDAQWDESLTLRTRLRHREFSAAQVNPQSETFNPKP